MDINKKTFQKSISTPEEFYFKFERTFNRRSSYGDNQIDWVFDCSIAAWHLIDWLNGSNKKNLKVLQQQYKSKCPELSVCEQICNGAKHLTLTNPNLTPFNISRDVKGTSNLTGISKPFKLGEKAINVEVVVTSDVIITDKYGNTWRAINLFRRILFFWEKELNIE